MTERRFSRVETRDVILYFNLRVHNQIKFKKKKKWKCVICVITHPLTTDHVTDH